MMDQLGADINRLNLRDNVIMTGYVPDDKLPILYSGASVFVYPSLYEGFGLPPLEAMKCGTPVIVSNVSSLPEVVGDAGIKINPRHEEDLTEALKRILEDAKLSQELSVRGLEHSRMFSWVSCAQTTRAVYEKITGNRKAVKEGKSQ